MRKTVLVLLVLCVVGSVVGACDFNILIDKYGPYGSKIWDKDSNEHGNGDKGDKDKGSPSPSP
jgi:hypothetical protein